ncbi:DEKNAAC102713 [Brettanomyces naardenensis]|uniref:Ribokinase n=1 Tax=Brettanomyces naardenensis TaxID=13370 RepID=A0A448YL19_BRENA|nr:DEKNAAC102713 [Brettanomyces naardenensis]
MITIIGSLNYDMVTYTKRVPEAGETVQGDFFEAHLGGKGMNECVAVASLVAPGSGSKVRMWGRIGDDPQGELFLKKLKSLNVDTTLVKKLSNIRSGSATILVEDLTGENRIVVIGGANGKLHPTATELAENFPLRSSEKQYVVLQNEFPDPLAVIDWLSNNRPEVVTFYNPSPLKKELLNRDTLNKVSFLVVNRTEAWDLVGEEEQDDNTLVITKLRKLLDKPTFIVTLGSKGCIFSESGSDTFRSVPSRKVNNVVDTTGAGDTFLGGIVTRLHGGDDLEEAINFAAAASSLAIQVKGAVEGIPNYKAVEALLI